MDDRAPAIPHPPPATTPPPQPGVEADTARLLAVLEPTVLATPDIGRTTRTPSTRTPTRPRRPAHPAQPAQPREVPAAAPSDDLQQPPHPDTGLLQEPSDGHADSSTETQQRILTEDHDRIAHDLNNTLVHQMFTVSLDLHAALARINDHHAAEKIHRAIDGLDQAIKHLRTTIFDVQASPARTRPQER